MSRYEYMWVPVKLILKDIFDAYNLKGLVSNSRVLVEIRKEIHGLPQVDKLAYDKLLTHVANGGYIFTGITAGLFKYHAKPITFCIIVDDFGVKYTHH